MDSKKTIGEFLKELTTLLTPIADEFAQSEAQTILEYLLECNRSFLYLNRSKEIDQTIQQKALSILQERLSHKPLPYILGQQFFYEKEFLVSADTLIPRLDTEHLVEAIFNNEKNDDLFILELGTGTGIIPETLTSQKEHWRAISVDISWGALTTAQQNCNPQKVMILQSNLFSAIIPNQQFDIIVSNPPYIPTSVVQNGLDRSVTDFEPHLALDGGTDGLSFYHYLAQVGKEYLKPNGRLYLEIGYDQGKTVPTLLENEGWKNICLLKDFSQNDRVVIAQQ